MKATDPSELDYTPQAQRLAAAAPQRDGDDDSDGELVTEEQSSLDALCERWVHWCRTRRLYAPAPALSGILGKITKSSRPMRLQPPDAAASMELAAFHIAYTCQPDAIDKRAFDLYYVYRVKPVKVAADALGISRQHYYTLLASFRRRVFTASKSIVEENMAALAALPHSVDR
jgi:hypothetical protein